MHVYALHGLGLDGRIFDHLDLGQCHLQPIHHLDPTTDEPWDSYVDRHVALIKQSHTASEPFLLLGHSLGGILAQEIAQRLAPAGLILVSTICQQAELPPTLAVLRKIPAHKFWRRDLVKRSYIVWGERDGYNTPTERSQFYEMTDSHSDYYYSWAVQRIINWPGDIPSKCPRLRLHGDADYVFPLKYVRDTTIEVIPGGSHIMVKSQADVISTHIRAFARGITE